MQSQQTTLLLPVLASAAAAQSLSTCVQSCLAPVLPSICPNSETIYNGSNVCVQTDCQGIEGQQAVQYLNQQCGSAPGWRDWGVDIVRHPHRTVSMSSAAWSSGIASSWAGSASMTWSSSATDSAATQMSSTGFSNGTSSAISTSKAASTASTGTTATSTSVRRTTSTSDTSSVPSSAGGRVEMGMAAIGFAFAAGLVM